MEDDLREQETCLDVIESSISVVECVSDLVNTVVNQEWEKNQAPKPDKTDAILKTDSQQQQPIPILVDYAVEDPVYCNIEKQYQQVTEEKTEVKEKSKRREKECSVNSLHLLFEEVNAVLTEILESVTSDQPATQEEDVSTKSDYILQDDGDERSLSIFNQSDNHEMAQQNEEEKFEEITIDEIVECPLDGLRSLLKTVPYIKLPVPEPSPPSPSVTPEIKDEREVEHTEKKPVDYLQVLRILRPPPPPQMESENSENGATDVSNGPNGNEKEKASSARKNARSVAGSTEVSPVKIPDIDQESTNSDSTIFIAKTRRQSKKNHSEKVTPVFEICTPISTDSENKEIKKQKKEKAIKKKAKIRIDEDNRNDCKSNLHAKEEAKPPASTIEPVPLQTPKIILSRCDNLVRLSRKRKRSESNSSLSQPSPEKVEVSKNGNCTTNSHSTIFMSSVLQKLRNKHLAKVKQASATMINKESETEATKKKEKEEPVKTKTKVNLDKDDRDRDDANSNSTICVWNERFWNMEQNHAGKQNSASEFIASDSITSLDLEKQMKHKRKKEKPAKKRVKKAEKRQKEVLDGKDNTNTSSESLFLIISPTKSSFTNKDKVSESTSTNTSKSLLSTEKKMKLSRVPAIAIKTEEENIDTKQILTTAKNRVSFSVINKDKEGQATVQIDKRQEIKTREKNPKGKGWTQLEVTSTRSKKKKGKKSVDCQKRKRSSSPVPSSSTENSDAALIKKWSLKPCYVVLRRDSIDLLEKSSFKKKGTSKKIEQSMEPEVIVISGDEDKSDVVYPCPICDRTFSISAKLEKHLKKKHPTPASPNKKEKPSKPYACEHCKKKFSSESAMHLHARSHLDEASYKCNKCEEHFMKKSELRSHQKRHEEMEVHDCAVCGKVFQHALAKKLHVANHFTKAPFRCSICNKGFPLQKGLQLHIRIKHKQKGK